MVSPWTEQQCELPIADSRSARGGRSSGGRALPGHVGQIAIVRVGMEVDAAEGAGQRGCQGSFAGAGAAGNSHHDRWKGETRASPVSWFTADFTPVCGAVIRAWILGTSR